MSARRALPIALALCTSGMAAGCPGFGDRLPPDAAPDDASGPGVDTALDGDLGRRDATPSDGAPVPADASPPRPFWEPEIADFMARHCSLCHGETPVGGAPYALVTYEQVRPHLAAIVHRTVDLRDMPPGGGLVTDEERAALVAWVEAGAPRTAEDVSPPGAAAER